MGRGFGLDLADSHLSESCHDLSSVEYVHGIFLFCKDMSPLGLGHHTYDLNFPKAPPAFPITSGVRISIYGFEGRGHNLAHDRQGLGRTCRSRKGV